MPKFEMKVASNGRNQSLCNELLTTIVHRDRSPTFVVLAVLVKLCFILEMYLADIFFLFCIWQIWEDAVAACSTNNRGNFDYKVPYTNGVYLL